MRPENNIIEFSYCREYAQGDNIGVNYRLVDWRFCDPFLVANCLTFPSNVQTLMSNEIMILYT